MDDDTTLTTAGAVLDWRALDQTLEVRHQRGLTRLEALAADILRIRFTPGERFAPDRDWDVVDPQPAATARIEHGDDRIRYVTESITARLDIAGGALAFEDADGRVYAEDLGPPGWREMAREETALEHMPDAELPPGSARTALFLDKRMADDEAYFGFGQRTGRLDRRHRRLTNWSIDRSSPGHCRGNDNMYQVHPVFLALRPDHCWGLFLHSTWYSGFDVGARIADTLTLYTLGGELDYYLFAGPTPAAVVEQLTRLTGRPALPPLWSLGYHQSRWSYRSAEQVLAVAAGFRDRRIPLDAIHFDIDYMDGYRVFTWDKQRFPDPPATIAALHDQGIRAAPIVDPGVKKELDAGYAVADSGAAGGHFVRRPDGSLFSGYVWPGESLFPDFCRADTRRWWGDWHRGLLEAGVDGIWCDMNEPAIVDRPFGQRGVRDRPIPLAARHGERGEALQAETHNVYGLLMARAAAEGQARLRPERRPWTLTRSAYVGVQRWAATWMGDNSAWWEHLEMSLPQLASMGLCGSPHVGVDIGGFYHNCPPELFARWMELGAFYPFMRGHTHHRTRAHEPWAFGAEVEAVARQAIELRYRLLPYLYTLAHRAHRRGEPLLRPLLYDFPGAAELHQIEDQVMLGPQLMVAPVCQPGVRRRLVELPPGTWYGLHDGAMHEAGPLVAEAPLGRTPVLVRAGSILTLGNVRQSTAEPLTELTLDAYPDPSGPGRWTLIEDDGESLAYLDGALAETEIEMIPDGKQLTLAIAARRGAYVPPERRLAVRLHVPGWATETAFGEAGETAWEWDPGRDTPNPPLAVRLDGIETHAWEWDPQRRALRLGWIDNGAAHRLEIRRL